MRIRRNASKILGAASLAYAANPNCPSTPATAAGAEAEDFTVCELNCSPWDLMATDPNSSYCDFLITNLKGEGEEEEEEGEGILGNTIKADEPGPTTSAAAELTLKEMKEIEEKKLVKRRRISKGKEKDTSIAYCKKTDGKGWHCKRQAQLPNSLCSYHLAQIKAYSSNHRAALTDSPSTVPDTTGKCSSNHRKRKVAGEEATDKDSGFYYYYEGFGPWRGKRRGRPVSAGSNASALSSRSGNVKVKEDSSSKESTVLDNGDDDDDDDDDDNDNAIAGDDEYDLDHFEELDDHRDNYTTHYNEREDTNVAKKEAGLEKKRVAKKRGRKPFKCRSLKSLL